MTDKTQNTKEERIIYLYCVTNLINQKVYIGQTVDPGSRWHGHIRDARNPKVPFHFAIQKYGSNNFKYEIIACCKGQDNANEAETLLVAQYDSFVSNEKGYNATHGGLNAPKSDQWKESMKKWRESLSEEEKQNIRNKQSEATKNQIITKGHPASGHKWTERQKQALSEWRSTIDYNAMFTPEIIQKMQESHLGKTLPKEQVEKMSESIKAAWEKKNTERYIKDDIRCHADGCSVAGKAKYNIVNNVRYCAKHGLRAKRNGHTELLPKSPVIMTKEIRKKISTSKIGKNLGRIPHNKTNLTQDQINLIINDPGSIMELSKRMNLGRKIIGRIRREYKK